MSEIDILVCYHKESKIFENECLKPIQVGKDCTDIKLPMISDNTGDNISYKNFHYSELTATYWLWKNSNAKYKGLLHYRRFLDLTKQNPDIEYHCIKYDDIIDSQKFLDDYGMNRGNIEKIFENADIITRNSSDLKKWSKYTIKSHYSKYHSSKHLEYATEIISEKYPQYMKSWKALLKDSVSYYTNTLIMKGEDFNQYCEWLFSILFAVEEKLNLFDPFYAPNTFNARWGGFLGERLTGLYIRYQAQVGKKVYEYPAIILEGNENWQNVSTYDEVLSDDRDIVIENDNKPIISVCVSVYNSEKYLSQCLDSIINSTLKNIEIICVNDGSTDNSAQILKEYAIKDSRIVVIDKTVNEGTGQARNICLERAQGKYIGFVDADDYIDKNFLKHMVQNAQKYNSDMVISTYRAFNENNGETLYKSTLMHTLYNKDCINLKICPELMFVSCEMCNKIYKLSSIREIKLPHRGCAEDVYFYFNVISLVDRISVHRQSEYNYRIHSNSIQENLECIKNAFQNIEKTYNYLEANHKNLMPYFSLVMYSLIMHYICRGTRVLLTDDNFREYFYSEVKKVINKIYITNDCEKYFPWYNLDIKLLKKMYKCKTLQDFDRLFNTDNCNKDLLYILYNYTKFKLKKSSQKEKYKQRVYKKIKSIPTSIPLNILGVRVRINKSLFSGIEKEMSLK